MTFELKWCYLDVNVNPSRWRSGGLLRCAGSMQVVEGLGLTKELALNKLCDKLSELGAEIV